MGLLGEPPKIQLEGRAAEVAALGEAWEEACAGRGRIVVVTGEAGIGKSTLVAALAERAERGGVKAVWGRAWEFADAPAYFPLWPCFGALGLQATAREQPPFTLWETVLGALSALTREAPQLWLLEDLHAADLQTLDLLAFLAQPLRVLRGLVVVTARERDPRLSERGEQRLLRMARDGLDLRLAPLGREGVMRLALQYAGDVSAAAVNELLEITSGNPLFVVECARAIKSGGFRARPVSPSIRQVVLERLQLLPEPTRQLLESGAVLGRDFTAAQLARMHGQLPARVVDTLLPALRGGVVLERQPGSFAFSHVVVQGAVYESLPAEQRGRLHRAAEQALATLPEGAEILLERVRHALGGLLPETEAAALSLARSAARLLEQSGAYDRAHALYSRLREKAASGELTGQFEGPELLHMAQVAELAGRASEGRALCLSVLSRARADADWLLFAEAALALGRTLRPGLVDAELVEALRESLGRLGEPSSPLACRLIARLAAALQPAPEPQGPIEMATEAIALAHRIGEPALILEVLDVAGSAYVDYAPLELRLRTSEALLVRALAAGDVARAQRARARLAFERAELGNFDAYDELVRDLLSEAERTGQARARIRPLLMASLGACNRGRLAESEEYLVEARQLVSLTDDPALTLSFHAHLASRALAMHLDPELELLEQQLPQMVRGVPDSALVLAALRCFVRTRQERVEAARDDLRKAWAGLNRWAQSFVPMLAEAAAFTDEREIAQDCYARLLPLAGTDALGGHVSVSYDGPVDRLLGLLDAVLGRPQLAEQRLRACLALAERRGFDAWVAQGHYDLGKLFSAVGRASEAQAAWRRAAALAEASQMSGLLSRSKARLSGVLAATEASAAPALRETSAGVPSLSMVREGELFRVERGSVSIRIRATRGAELLARLVDAPNREIHVLALASDEAQATTESNAGDSIDRTALRQYRARLAELARLSDGAEERGDLGRLDALRRERALLEREIARALGMGGRARQAGSTSERARVNVQRRLKDAIERVAEASPELGAWLQRAVRTGTYCSFHPGI